ncbi:Hypothetical predicted protein [Olea europaea subsp. europaea]|nr:Hypothetical predicted protein [Olea europaea subsp. europaea]
MLLLLLLICEGDAMTKESMASRGEGEVKVRTCTKDIDVSEPCDEIACENTCTKLNIRHVSGSCTFSDTCTCQYPC